MNNIIKSKSYLAIILSIVIVFMSAPLNASLLLSSAAPSPAPTAPIAPTPSEHKETIRHFISEIRDIQNQVFDIAQFALNNPPLFKAKLTANISLINNNIDSLNKRISDYLETVPAVGDQNIHVLLTLNALNFVKNGLFSLSVLTNTTENVQRIALLDQYFRSRIAGIDTLNTAENLLLQYNP